MKNIKFITSSSMIMLILLSVQSVSLAAVYKWTDSDGQVHYSDRPQADGAEKMNIQDNKAALPGRIDSDAKQADKDTAETQDNKADSKPKMVEVEPSRAQKNRYCEEARRDIAAINSRGRMREVDDKGEYTYLSEKQRQQRLSAAKKKQREFCR